MASDTPRQYCVPRHSTQASAMTTRHFLLRSSAVFALSLVGVVGCGDDPETDPTPDTTSDVGTDADAGTDASDAGDVSTDVAVDSRPDSEGDTSVEIGSWEPEAAPEEPVYPAMGAACVLDFDCAEDRFCFIGICSTECDSDDACGAGETCSARGQCLNGAGKSLDEEGEPAAPEYVEDLRLVELPDTYSACGCRCRRDHGNRCREWSRAAGGHLLPSRDRRRGKRRRGSPRDSRWRRDSIRLAHR